jgi:hypothetical protein
MKKLYFLAIEIPETHFDEKIDSNYEFEEEFEEV